MYYVNNVHFELKYKTVGQQIDAFNIKMYYNNYYLNDCY